MIEQTQCDILKLKEKTGSRDMKDIVVLKVKKDRLKIYLDPKIEFCEIKRNLLDKITEVKNFVGDVRTAVEFAGREISETEEDELLKIIRDNSSM